MLVFGRRGGGLFSSHASCQITNIQNIKQSVRMCMICGLYKLLHLNNRVDTRDEDAFFIMNMKGTHLPTSPEVQGEILKQEHCIHDILIPRKQTQTASILQPDLFDHQHHHGQPSLFRLSLSLVGLGGGDGCWRCFFLALLGLLLR